MTSRVGVSEKRQLRESRVVPGGRRQQRAATPHSGSSERDNNRRRPSDERPHELIAGVKRVPRTSGSL